MRESLTRTSSLSFASGIVTFVVASAGNVLLARALGPDAKGLLVVYMATLAVLVIPGHAIQSAVLYVVAHQRPSRPSIDRLTLWMVATQTALSMALVVVLIQIEPVRRVLLPHLGNVFVFVLAISLAVTFWAYYRSAILPGVGRYSRYVYLGTLYQMMSTGLLVLALAIFYVAGQAVTVQSIILVTTVPLVAGAVAWQFATRGVPIPDTREFDVRELGRVVLRFAGPVLLRNLVEFLNYRGDVYLVASLAGAGALGLYTVAVGLGQQLWMIPFAVSGPLFARISAEGGTEGSRETTIYAFKLTTAISVVLAVLAAASCPVLIPAVYGPAFQGSVVPLLAILPGVAAAGGTRVLNAYFSGNNRNGETVKAELLALVATISLNFLLVPRYGATGASLASTAAYTVSSIFLVGRFIRVARLPWVDVLAVRHSDFVRLRQSVSTLPSIGSLLPWSTG